MGGQERKQLLGLAGEFLVAGELNRRWIPASVTFGASKRADIFAYHSDWKSPARIEVKTTDKNKWLVGKTLLEEINCKDAWFWVLVHIPRGVTYEDPSTDVARGVTAPRYFILTSKELGMLVRNRTKKYNEEYRHKHGRDYDGKPMPSVRIRDVRAYEGAWRKLQEYFLDRHTTF